MRTRAAVLREMGRAGPYADTHPLSVEEVDLDPPGPGEVLVRNAAAGLCHSDLSVVDGARPRPMPMVLGHEAAGIVEEVGAGVTLVRPGDHVVYSFVPMCGACVPCQSGRVVLCEAGAAANARGELLGGGRRLSADGAPLNHHLGVSGFAERSVVSAASLVPVGDTIPLAKAALFGCALATGVGSIVNTAGVRPGESVAVFGLGGVGLSAVMGAVLAGASTVVAVDAVPAKLELATQAGARHTVLAGEHTVEQVRDLTGGGVDWAVECVGSAAVLAQAYASARRGGAAVAVGLPHPSQVLEIPAVSLVAEEKRIIGSYMGSAVPRRDVPRMIAAYEAGRLPVDLLDSGSLELDEVNVGLDRLASGAAVRQILRLSVD
ncbi:MAG: zinc-binding dehydrogenase [Propionibacteriales bacterium]|nr:zinc-binding dehydrogenase [Propionibacteriales bacterium]